MDNYFSSPPLFDDMFRGKISARGTVCHDKRQIPHDTGPNAFKLKRKGTVTQVRGKQGCSLERQA
jgi:hypothetical protein